MLALKYQLRLITHSPPPFAPKWALLGKGAPDIIVGYNNLNYLVEIKDGDKPKAQQKLTPDEVKFQSEWKGNYYVINCFDKLRDIILQDEL